MKAIAQERYGDASVLALADMARPEAGEDGVLVRVRAAGVAMGDWHMMTGQPYMMRPGTGLRAPRQKVRGTDIAGTVEAVGAKVTEFKVGDEVFGWGGVAFAEYARSKERQLVKKPAAISFEQAAAVPTSGCTALQALRDAGRLQAGQNVLVVGASGGVGTFAVQIAKALGAEVTGVCSTVKVELVRSLGADHVVDYKREDIAAGGKQYDLVLDIGGNRPLSKLRSVLSERGTLVIVGGKGGRMFMGIGRSLRAAVLSPFVKHTMKPLFASSKKVDLAFVSGLIEEGKVTPVVDRTFPLAEAPEAIRYLDEGKVAGKLVLTV
jgi:NADPH:quinone reductase-like Zn-dependent oxidoreductase